MSTYTDDENSNDELYPSASYRFFATLVIILALIALAILATSCTVHPQPAPDEIDALIAKLAHSISPP